MQTLQRWVWEKLPPSLLIQRLWILFKTFHLPVYTVLSDRHSLPETIPLEAPFSSVLWSCWLKGRTDLNISLCLFYLSAEKVFCHQERMAAEELLVLFSGTLAMKS